MTDEEMLKKLSAFAYRDVHRPTLQKIKTQGRVAYVTDGRIAFRAQLDGEHESQEQEEGKPYPIERLSEIFSWADNLSDWRRMDIDGFEQAAKEFEKKWHEERHADERISEDRYKLVVCPHCGEDVYWDTWSDKLVEQQEKHLPVEPRDITLGTWLVFGERKCAFNVGYLRMLRMTFGDVFSFALEEREDNDEPKTLFMRSDDGRLLGVLMPVRVADGYEIKHTIAMS